MIWRTAVYLPPAREKAPPAKRDRGSCRTPSAERVTAPAAKCCINDKMRRPTHAARRQQLTSDELSYKMLYMKKISSISIRELQQNLKRVMARVARGQVFEVTRHR